MSPTATRLLYLRVCFIGKPGLFIKKGEEKIVLLQLSNFVSRFQVIYAILKIFFGLKYKLQNSRIQKPISGHVQNRLVVNNEQTT